jgi:hypothetical protein
VDGVLDGWRITLWIILLTIITAPPPNPAPFYYCLVNKMPDITHYIVCLLKEEKVILMYAAILLS